MPVLRCDIAPAYERKHFYRNELQWAGVYAFFAVLYGRRQAAATGDCCDVRYLAGVYERIAAALGLCRADRVLGCVDRILGDCA